VAAICRRGMKQFGYADGLLGPLRAIRVRARIGPEDARQLRRYLDRYREYLRYITATTL
jgi:hypothetical protein